MLTGVETSCECYRKKERTPLGGWVRSREGEVRLTDKNGQRATQASKMGLLLA